MSPHDAALEAAVVACEMQSEDTLVNRHMMPRFVDAYLAALSATHVVLPREVPDGMTELVVALDDISCEGLWRAVRDWMETGPSKT